MIWYVIVVVAAFLAGALYGGWKVDEWLRKEHLKELEFAKSQRRQLAEWCAHLSNKFYEDERDWRDWIEEASDEIEEVLKERA